MRKIFLFMITSLDGYFEGPGHDLSWHNVDAEFNIFAAKQMQEIDMILFGHRTYTLMRDFWPQYLPTDPENEIVRNQLITLPKIVFSKTLKTVEESENWRDVTVMHKVKREDIIKLKKKKGKPIAVLGSSNFCVTLLQLGLLDELRIMINPVLIGQGTPLFENNRKKYKLDLLKTRTFTNGNILSYYQVEN